MKIKLITAFILRRLDSWCLVYHGLSDELNTRLQRLVNCGIRFIYDLRRDIHHHAVQTALGLALLVENMRMHFPGAMAYRVNRYIVPSYISDLFSSSPVDPQRSSRLPGAVPVYHIPLHRTTANRNSFRLSVAYFWNSLSFDITSAPSLPGKKTSLGESLAESHAYNPI